MGKALVIAEKPSVAADISRALGKFKNNKEFFENDEYVISSAVGHLLELDMPRDAKGKKPGWKFEVLPLLPEKFELKPIERSAPRLKVLQKLMKRKDVDVLINACDAGREGELIFRYILQATGVDKPVRRLWLQSMTPDAVRQGFKSLRDGKELEPLAEAAICRSESDWLVGINGTRALTAFNSKGGGFRLTPVGRVQTPTLTILVEREDKIKKFEPKDYWEVHGEFAAKAGGYAGRWFDEAFKKPTEGGDEAAEKKAERIWEQKKADAIVAACQGKHGEVTEEKKPATQLSPLLFDLTSLQREANSKFGLSARRTLQLAQALYEKHKALTYPRTDSRYLPEDYPATVLSTLEKLKVTHLGNFCQTVLSQGWVKPTKRVFNNAKVSDHFAIIPTGVVPAKLDEYEQRIFDLVTKRFLAIFYPAAVFEVTTRITRVENHAFKTEGKVLKEPGWLAIYGKEETPDDAADTLVPVEEGETVLTDQVEARGLQTRPPARFSEATLLSAMEGAGKLVDDEELREAMSEKGLGTPATRAAIIEGLLGEQYIVRDGRELIPTPKAFALLETLRAIDIPGLSSPQMTGEWEYKLKRIEDRQMNRETFMAEIRQLVQDIVDKTKGFDETKVGAVPFGANDPFSGQPLFVTLRDYRTEDGSFTIPKAIGGRIIAPEEVKELLDKRMIGPLDGFRSRIGRPFSAAMKLNDERKVELVWDQEKLEDAANIDFSKEEPVGVSPINPEERVFETPSGFVGEFSIGKKGPEAFRIGKKILSKELEREQVRKLLAEGKTDLLLGFVSTRTKRPFKAFLILKEGGKLGFEFPPREPKQPKGKKAKGSKKADSVPEEGGTTPEAEA